MRTLTIAVAVLLTTLPGTAWSGGEVGGAVIYQGSVPSAKRRPITVDTPFCGQEAVSEEFLVGKRGALKNAVVFIEGPVVGGRLPPPPDGGFVVDQNKCRFEPHVVVVPVGAPLKVMNSDPVLHNFHTISRANPPQNKAQPPSAPVMTLQFDRPEIFNVKCDVHGWMSLWVAVVNNPYYAVTGEDGRYRIKDVPAGDYNIAVWHEVLGTKVRRITVKEGEELPLDLTFTSDRQGGNYETSSYRSYGTILVPTLGLSLGRQPLAVNEP